MRVYLLLVGLVLATLLFGGCLGQSVPTAPDYRPPTTINYSQSTPTASAPSNSAISKNTTVPPKKNTSAPTNASISKNATVPKNASASNASSPLKTNATLNTTRNQTGGNATAPVVSQPICGGMNSSGALDCIAQTAIARKDVTLCTQLAAQEDRAKCFTRWCYSSARDYKACDRLTNNDDMLGCKQKCSPNFNT